MIGVSIEPGHTQLARMPSRAYSTAMTFVRASTPPLLAEYAAAHGCPASAAVDAVFTMAPPPASSRAGMAARQQAKVPVRLTASTRSQVSKSCSWVRAVRRIPATLATTWRAPNRSTAVATAASETAGSLTSPVTSTTASPARSHLVATSRATTCAPSATSRSTVARPMPDAAPVTRATFPANRCTSPN